MNVAPRANGKTTSDGGSHPDRYKALPSLFSLRALFLCVALSLRRLVLARCWLDDGSDCDPEVLVAGLSVEQYHPSFHVTLRQFLGAGADRLTGRVWTAHMCCD